MQSFSFIPFMASEKKIFEFLFRKFSFSVAMGRKPMSKYYACSSSSHGYTAPLRIQKLCTGPVKPASARTCYINEGNPEYVPFTQSRPCTDPGRLPRGLLRAQNRRKLCMLSFQPRLYCALTYPKVFQKSCGPARNAM